MTHDITDYDEITQPESDSAPPLCLVHYFAERAAYPPERPPKPPGGRLIGRVAERRGNLIILEFSQASAPDLPPAKWRGGRSGKSLLMRVCDALLLVLLFACLLGCLAAFRF